MAAKYLAINLGLVDKKSSSTAFNTKPVANPEMQATKVEFISTITSYIAIGI